MLDTLKILGFMPDGSPIFPISGSEPDDDIDTSTTGDEDETDDPDDDNEDEAAEYTPPTKEEWDKVQAALKKANDEAKKRRLRQKQKASDKDGDAPDVDKVREETEVKWKTRVIRAEARGALAGAGVEPGKVAKALRLLDMDEIDVDDEGEVDGLDDQIEELKEEFPELFAPKHDAASHGRRVPRVNGAGKTGTPKAKSSADLLAGALLGSRK